MAKFCVSFGLLALFLAVSFTDSAQIKKFRTPCTARTNRFQRLAMTDSSHYWPNGTVYYDFASHVSSDVREVVENGFREIEEKTGCISFVQDSSQDSWVEVTTNEDGCFATMGMWSGKQQLNLGEGCQYEGTAMHETYHSLGFEHEHNRPDRDDYVEIAFDNIQEEYKDQFYKADSRELSTQGITYDYLSIMQYPSYNSFAIDYNKPTIIAKDEDYMPIEDNVELTDSDVERVRKLYRC